MSTRSEGKELSHKIFEGMKLAYRRFYEMKAAKNECVVIMVNGEIKRVPAKDLLDVAPKQ